MKLAEAMGLTLHGQGEKTVLLGHGFGTTQATWAHQIPALVQAGYRVACFDMAGATPASEALFDPARHGSLYGFAEDLLGLVREARLDNVHYVGHSVAGMVGLLAGNAAPELIRSLVLIGASAHYVDDPATDYQGGFSPEQVTGLLAAMRENHAAWANGFAPLAMGQPNRPELALEFSRSLQNLRPDIAWKTFSVILTSDHRAEAAANTLPTWLLQTEQDVAVPDAAARWLARACRARALHIIPTTGHFPQRSAPEAVNRTLLEVLDRATA